MEITTVCPECGQKLGIPSDLAGQFVDCPKCKGTVLAPELPSPSPVHDSSPSQSSRGNGETVAYTTAIGTSLITLMALFEFWALLNIAVLLGSVRTGDYWLAIVCFTFSVLQVISAWLVGKSFIEMKRSREVAPEECYSIALWTGVTGLLSLNVLAVCSASILYVCTKASE